MVEQKTLRDLLCLWTGIATMLVYMLANVLALGGSPPLSQPLDFVFTLNFAIASISIAMFSIGITGIIIEKLLLEGEIRADNKVLMIQKRNIREIMDEHNTEYTIGLSSRGHSVNLYAYMKAICSKHRRVAIIVGAFAHGFYSSQIQEFIDDLISIGPETYSASYVLCKVITLSLIHI